MSIPTSENRPTKILITNLHSVRNSGDHVLLQVALEQLYSRFIDAEITLAMNDPSSYPKERPEQVVGSFTHWVKHSTSDRRGWRLGSLLSAPLWLLQIWMFARSQRRQDQPGWLPRSAERRALLLAYCQADIVVSSAGNFLYSSGLFQLPLLLHLLALVYGSWIGKPVYMLPQTLGPFRSWWETCLIKQVLGGVRVAMLRDLLSKHALEHAGIHHSNVVVLPDIAFLYRGHDSTFMQNLLERHRLTGANRPPLLGVTLINWQAQHGIFRNQEQYEAAVATAVRAFVEEKGGIAILFAQVFGPTLVDDDRIPARRVSALLADLGDHIIQIDEEIPPEQLKAGYGAVDIFLGSRLHSNIFALCEGTPVLAIAYQYKTHGIMQMLGLNQWVINIEDASAENLWTALDRLWCERIQVTEQVREAVAAVKTEAERAIALIHPEQPQNDN